MQILNHRQIAQKIKRLAIEILEHNTAEEELFVAGINNNGLHFARLLVEELQQFSDLRVELTQIKLNPADPQSQEISIGLDLESLSGKPILIVDDVANTGRTLFYACRPIMAIVPSKLEVAVLVDRTHKSFPIKVDYFGLSLATTLRENIDVRLENKSDYAVHLK